MHFMMTHVMAQNPALLTLGTTQVGTNARVLCGVETGPEKLADYGFVATSRTLSGSFLVLSSPYFPPE